jgi:hypothetical protein
MKGTGSCQWSKQPYTENSDHLKERLLPRAKYLSFMLPIPLIKASEKFFLAKGHTAADGSFDGVRTSWWHFYH